MREHRLIWARTESEVSTATSQTNPPRHTLALFSRVAPSGLNRSAAYGNGATGLCNNVTVRAAFHFAPIPVQCAFDFHTNAEPAPSTSHAAAHASATRTHALMLDAVGGRGRTRGDLLLS